MLVPGAESRSLKVKGRRRPLNPSSLRRFSTVGEVSDGGILVAAIQAVNHCLAVVEAKPSNALQQQHNAGRVQRAGSWLGGRGIYYGGDDIVEAKSGSTLRPILVGSSARGIDLRPLSSSWEQGQHVRAKPPPPGL
jgi:hypothetical protein